jgi:hypothetical protein
MTDAIIQKSFIIRGVRDVCINGLWWVVGLWRGRDVIKYNSGWRLVCGSDSYYDVSLIGKYIYK